MAEPKPWWAPLHAATVHVAKAFEWIAKDMVSGMTRDYAPPPKCK